MDDNRILDNYIATIGESRRIMGNMLSILSHQETALQNIINANTIASQHVRNIPPLYQYNLYGNLVLADTRQAMFCLHDPIQ